MVSRVGILGAVVSLAGCAALTYLPPELGRPPTADERRIIEAFAPRVIAAARHEGFACTEVVFVVSGHMPNDAIRHVRRPSPDPCAFYIQMSARFVRIDSPGALAGSLAHELGHVINADATPARARVPEIDREREADRVAIRILKRLGTAECLALAEHFRTIRAENLAGWGVEQRDTTDTHPSYTERIRTFEAECRS
ncbi:MAG: hypothetical protein HYU41_15585 [Candidatus Rokubacteria bacterium]|nr:hypothetical protein [Candidatus Rokubacteria bacterium]